jgi:hypothetical protein
MCVLMLRAHNTCNVVINTINLTRVLFIVVNLATICASSSTVISKQWVVMDDERSCSDLIVDTVKTFTFIDRKTLKHISKNNLSLARDLNSPPVLEAVWVVKHIKQTESQSMKHSETVWSWHYWVSEKNNAWWIKLKKWSHVSQFHDRNADTVNLALFVTHTLMITWQVLEALWNFSPCTVREH